MEQKSVVQLSFRKEVEKQALYDGFSSLQEFIRVILKRYHNGQLNLTFVNYEVENLTPHQEKVLSKLVKDAHNDIVNGKINTAKDSKDLLRQLHSKI